VRTNRYDWSGLFEDWMCFQWEKSPEAKAPFGDKANKWYIPLPNDFVDNCGKENVYRATWKETRFRGVQAWTIGATDWLYVPRLFSVVSPEGEVVRGTDYGYSLQVNIPTDAFLGHTLHYGLSGPWNKKDGHNWAFDVEDSEKVRAYIESQFSRLLSELFQEHMP
jgi:hypothetical protein